ncbi:carbonic anhydrase [Planomonospora sp. ID82291]|uniref:carbonic anhydrase n=1 Tax=Planomonospora sp. ID82291 TaxID=2738136 RepID=UPI0018C36AA7|nr:carbonic anhydrase [Planomonospora sp. ID82291]MBG0814559.1 carbonic anhydrase [Planomonospora sp. ID82291]
MKIDAQTRRRILGGAVFVTGALLAGAGLGGTALAESAFRARPRRDEHPETPEEAWAELRAGNRRWESGIANHPHQGMDRRSAVARKQEPYAVVVSCIDSRVPPEVVFDTGLGDLLVVRTAAQTIDPLVTGAVEYGPAELDVPLIVVLGHQRCGAVTATAEALREGRELPGRLRDIASALRPAYERSGGNVDEMIRINTVDVAARLKADRLLAPRIAKQRLKVVGAHYSLDTGKVTRVV